MIRLLVLFVVGVFGLLMYRFGACSGLKKDRVTTFYVVVVCLIICMDLAYSLMAEWFGFSS
jgi:hypothetical protein